MNDFGLQDHLANSTNPAIKRAREDLNKLVKSRAVPSEKDMDDEAVIDNRIENWPLYLECTPCRQSGIKKKYNKYDMTHTVYRGKYKGKPVLAVSHRCPHHAEGYRPQKDRAGNINE